MYRLQQEKGKFLICGRHLIQILVAAGGTCRELDMLGVAGHIPIYFFLFFKHSWLKTHKVVKIVRTVVFEFLQC